jgi:hypothetical protein
MNSRSEAQRVIDLTFSIAGMISDPAYRKQFDALTHQQRMEWVARQLRECGFPTQPMGASWGVLTRA